MAYGGDFGDDPNDGHFVMDGLCFADHTPTPGLTEYKKVIEPVQALRLDRDKVTIINRYDTTDLNHLKCTWRIVTDGGVLEGGEVELPKGMYQAPSNHPVAARYLRDTTQILSRIRRPHSLSISSTIAFRAKPTSYSHSLCASPPTGLRPVTKSPSASSN